MFVISANVSLFYFRFFFYVFLKRNENLLKMRVIKLKQMLKKCNQI
jgi:hypothetical protein